MPSTRDGLIDETLFMACLKREEWRGEGETGRRFKIGSSVAFFVCGLVRRENTEKKVFFLLEMKRSIQSNIFLDCLEVTLQERIVNGGNDVFISLSLSPSPLQSFGQIDRDCFLVLRRQ